MQKVIGVKPKPRALIHGFDEATTSALGSLFSTWIAYRPQADRVRLAEWDVLVTNDPSDAAPHLDLVAFSDSFGPSAGMQGSDNLGVLYGGTTYAREFVPGPNLHPDLAALVERVLLPRARAREENDVLHVFPINPMAVLLGGTPRTLKRAMDSTLDWVTPFLCTTEPMVLAGAFVRPGGRSEAWCLPRDLADDPVPWVRAAVRVWHDRNPDRYPHDPGWPSDPRWMTDEEVRLLAAIDDLERERTAYLAESKQREAEIRHELRVAQDAAEGGARLLLTAQGDALVAAVQTALEQLGFDVEDRDRLVPEGQPRLEDLRVTAPADDAEWVALVEVKGGTGGASITNMLKINRFVLTFRETAGRLPSRTWYIVNQFIGRDPGSRQPILHGHDAEVAEFESQSGMAMDTTSLFELLRSVENGTLDAAVARRHLMDALGRYTPLT